MFHLLTSRVHIAVITTPFSNEPLLLHVRSTMHILTRDTSFVSTGRSPVGSSVGTDVCAHNTENINNCERAPGEAH